MKVKVNLPKKCIIQYRNASSYLRLDERSGNNGWAVPCSHKDVISKTIQTQTSL